MRASKKQSVGVVLRTLGKVGRSAGPTSGVKDLGLLPICAENAGGRDLSQGVSPSDFQVAESLLKPHGSSSKVQVCKLVSVIQDGR